MATIIKPEIEKDIDLADLKPEVKPVAAPAKPARSYIQVGVNGKVEYLPPINACRPLRVGPEALLEFLPNLWEVGLNQQTHQSMCPELICWGYLPSHHIVRLVPPASKVYHDYRGVSSDEMIKILEAMHNTVPTEWYTKAFMPILARKQTAMVMHP